MKERAVHTIASEYIKNRVCADIYLWKLKSFDELII